MNIAERIAIEQQIARKTIEVMVAAGYYVSVYDGQAIACFYTQDVEEALNAMMTVDEEWLHVAKKREPLPAGEKPFRRVGSVFFVYGNDGYDVVNDHSLILGPQMDLVEAYVEELEAS